MSDVGITITYSGADVLLDSGAFSQLIGAFSHHLPLRNLHWKPSASYSSASNGPSSPFSSSLPNPTSIRTIQSLGVRLEPIADLLLRSRYKPETRHLIQRSLLERPFCHLYFVVCDDSDTYRTQVRNDIRSWLSTIQGSPTLSAAAVTAKGFQGVESLQHQKNGSVTSLINDASTPRSVTPPVRPDTPSKDSPADEALSPASSSKEKMSPPSPEYLIVVITPPDGSSLTFPTLSSRGSPSPSPAGSASVHQSSEGNERQNKTGLGRFYSSSSSSKGSVVEKVKNDFNTSRRERVVHLTRLPALHSDTPARARHSDPTIFAELQTRLKECVSATFDAVVEMQAEVVKREGAKKSVPGWNYCKWMAGMECVASTFEGVGLYSDALAQYEDIEAGFLQCLQDRNLPFFSQVGATTNGDDSAPLLDTSKKNYRELILRNEITLFDFRSYVFAKRASLLGKLGRVSQVMNETPIFLSGVGAMLQGESLPRHFLESWTFSCSIDVVEQCQAWLIERGDVSAPGMEEDNDFVEKSPSSRAMEGQLSAAFHSSKAELLDLARRQLDKIGVAVGHLPHSAPFSLSLRHGNDKERELPPLPDEGDTSNVSKDGVITRQELLSAIESRQVFDLHYTSLTERVLAGWTSGGRRRNVLRLRSVLGSLDFFRQRYEQAYAKFTALPEPYAEGGWTIMEASHLAKQLECHAQLAKPYDRAWVSVVIALLETYPQRSAREGAAAAGDLGDKQDPSSRWLDPAFLYSQLLDRTKAFEQEVAMSRFEPMRVRIWDQVAQITSEVGQDGCEIAVKVENRSSCVVHVDDVRVCLVNGVGKELWFTSGKVEIRGGENELRLFCPQSNQPGKYVVDVSQIRLSKVIVQYLHRKGREDSREATVIDVLEDGDALHASLELSRQVWLDQSRNSTLTLWSGRNNIERGSIALSYKDSREPVKGLLEAKMEQQDSTPSAVLGVKEGTDGRGRELVLEGVSSQSTVRLSIPLHEYNGAADGTLTFLLDFDYWTKPEGPEQSGQSRKRQLKSELRLSVGLPLGVNVQDFFRQDRLFSKFLITSGTGGILRLGKMSLECEERGEDSPFEIGSPSGQSRDTIVTPSQTASYVFAISRKKECKSGSSRNLRLTLSFRTLQEEASQVLLAHLDRVMSAKGLTLSSGHRRCLQRAMTSLVSTDMDLNRYFAHGRLQFAPRPARHWRQLCRRWAGIQAGSTEEDLVVQVIGDTLRDVGESSGDQLEVGKVQWRELSLIVDVPRMSLVNAITMEVQGEGGQVRMGEVVQASIAIQTSFHWDSSVDEEGEGEGKGREGGKGVHLSVEVQSDFVNWLVVGSKRTVVRVRPSTATSGQESVHSEVQLSLVAMKTGNLCLPAVSIWPLADPIETTPPSHAHRDKESNAVQLQEDRMRLNQVQSINCDSYLTNEAQTLLVLPALPHADRRTYWMGL